jgi:oligopeptide/dipeptide ABC transporter ATP-binding protein
MTEAVAHLVLEDNRLQALALSIAERGGAQAVPALVRLIDVLEENGDLDRKTEGLAPSDDYARRAAAGTGLSRPELAVLLSSAKLVLQRALEESPVVDDPVLEEELLAAVPQPDPDHVLNEAAAAGEIASALDPPTGCRFHPRCPLAIDLCRTTTPEPRGTPHQAACHLVEA